MRVTGVSGERCEANEEMEGLPQRAGEAQPVVRGRPSEARTDTRSVAGGRHVAAASGGESGWWSTRDKGGVGSGSNWLLGSPAPVGEGLRRR